MQGLHWYRKWGVQEMGGVQEVGGTGGHHAGVALVQEVGGGTGGRVALVQEVGGTGSGGGGYWRSSCRGCIGTGSGGTGSGGGGTGGHHAGVALVQEVGGGGYRRSSCRGCIGTGSGGGGGGGYRRAPLAFISIMTIIITLTMPPTSATEERTFSESFFFAK